MAKDQKKNKKESNIKYGKCVVECVCGEKFETGSSKEEIHVEICSACHPFYTGKQKLVDTAGRVDRFKEKMEKASQAKIQKEQREKQKKSGKPKENQKKLDKN